MLLNNNGFCKDHFSNDSMCPEFVRRKVKGYRIFFLGKIPLQCPFECQNSLAFLHVQGKSIAQFWINAKAFTLCLLHTCGSRHQTVSEEDLRLRLGGVQGSRSEDN